jgi:hypothetical protein
MYIYIYIHTHTPRQTYTYKRIHIHIRDEICFLSSCLLSCVCINVFACVCLCVYASGRVCVCPAGRQRVTCTCTCKFTWENLKDCVCAHVWTYMCAQKNDFLPCRMHMLRGMHMHIWSNLRAAQCTYARICLVMAHDSMMIVIRGANYAKIRGPSY